MRNKQPDSYWQRDLTFAKKCEQLQNNVYHQLFGSEITIKRADWHSSDPRELVLQKQDKEDGIDVTIATTSGSITMQEKALRAREEHWNTFTIEYYQDRERLIPGELFHLKAGAYLHGYVDSDINPSGWIRWYLFDAKKLIKWIRGNEHKGIIRDTRSSRASFIAINYDDIPNRLIVARYPLAYVFNN